MKVKVTGAQTGYASVTKVQNHAQQSTTNRTSGVWAEIHAFM